MTPKRCRKSLAGDGLPVTSTRIRGSRTTHISIPAAAPTATSTARRRSPASRSTAERRRVLACAPYALPRRSGPGDFDRALPVRHRIRRKNAIRAGREHVSDRDPRQRPSRKNRGVRRGTDEGLGCHGPPLAQRDRTRRDGAGGRKRSGEDAAFGGAERNPSRGGRRHAGEQRGDGLCEPGQRRSMRNGKPPLIPTRRRPARHSSAAARTLSSPPASGKHPRCPRSD